MMRPDPTEYAPFFAGYIALVPESDVLAALEEQMREIPMLVSRVPREREQFRYAPGKWSIREVLGHVTDSERIFGHRAFCISRGERASLPAFEENGYAAHAPFDHIPLADIATEFTNVRRANLDFLRKLETSSWMMVGTANNHPASARALAFIMAGHPRHHINILQERYGIPGET